MPSSNNKQYKVKNTFVEFGQEEKGAASRRTRSDQIGPTSGDMEDDHEGTEEGALDMSGFPDGGVSAAALSGASGPAYVVPTTPSPFLHMSASPWGLAVPPFGFYGMDGLPPAYGEDALDPYGLGAAQGNPYLGEEGVYASGMYDPNVAGFYMPYGAYQVAGKNSDGGDGWGSEGGGQDGAQWDQEGSGNRRGGNRSGGKDRKGDGKGRDQRNAGYVGDEGGGKGKAKNRGGNMENVAMQQKPPNDVPIPDVYTTVMLRNIPNKYTREMLVRVLNQDYLGVYDFLYLPIDFKNKCNVGYGFINFRTTEACEHFIKQFHGVDVRQCLPGINSKKVAEVTPARMQGLNENVQRLRNSPVMNQLQEHPEWMPLLLDPNGNPEPFPQPDQVVSPVKPRGKGQGKGQQRSLLQM